MPFITVLGIISSSTLMILFSYLKDIQFENKLKILNVVDNSISVLSSVVR